MQLRILTNMCFTGKRIRTRKSGKSLKVEIIAIKGSTVLVNTGATILQTKITNWGDGWTRWIWKNFNTRASEQERCVVVFL